MCSNVGSKNLKKKKKREKVCVYEFEIEREREKNSLFIRIFITRGLSCLLSNIFHVLAMESEIV